MAEKVELTPAEKQKILRERRQAKMNKGKATDRLNNILSQGSSVKTSSVTSILDQEKPSSTTSSSIDQTPSYSATIAADEDPDHQDISTITPSPTEDIDTIFNKILKQQQDEHTESDPMSQFMKMFNDQQQQPTPQPQETKYNQEYQLYQNYQSKLWKFRFLIIRISAVLVNFGYHFMTIPKFHASTYINVRDYSPTDANISQFITLFSAVEVVIIASYYFICQKYGLFHAANSNNIILKIVSQGAMFLPQLKRYEIILARVLGYYDLIGIIIGDLSFVVVLFGLLSYLN
ncbi:unnamed protein product [Candida verbasci]|uniref:Golgi to ER traffic protein 2 n=1 Tax=Candida verbasci TaxID=1227364 RepID=A0A9W4TSF4_9ASCO|nr:unnamed protein product [Candida verbasci]